MDKKIYAVSLVYYTDENVPECGATIYVTSDKDITKMPTHIIKENIFVQEEMERNDCEGIGFVYEIPPKKYYAISNSGNYRYCPYSHGHLYE